MKIEEHNISRDFQRFLDSAAIDVLDDSVFDIRLIALQLFYASCSSAIFGQDGFNMRSTRSRMSKSRLS